MKEQMRILIVDDELDMLELIGSFKETWLSHYHCE